MALSYMKKASLASRNIEKSNTRCYGCYEFATVFAGPFFLAITLTIRFNGYKFIHDIVDELQSQTWFQWNKFGSAVKWPLLEWKRTLRKLISFRSLFVTLCKVLLLFELFKSKWVLFFLVKYDYLNAAE